MPSSLMIGIKLYGPFILSVIFLVTIFLVKKGADINLNPFKLFGLEHFCEIKIPISNVMVVRLILSIASILSMMSILLLDFSSFFPKHLKMEVFYDEHGINDSLAQFDKDEHNSFSIPADYATYQQKYYRDLDLEIARTLGIKKFFNIREGTIHSSGETSFVVEKVEGIQKYHISESRGEVLHILELPNQTPKQFKTFFEKMATRDDYINPSIWQLVTKHSVVFRPQFKQILAQNIKTEGVLFHHTVVGVTKVKIFPWPDFSNTIYFANFKGTGLVPVAYAIYR